MQPWATRFYASARWKKCRAGYIKFRRTIDGGLCEECRDKPGYIVHHKRALTPDNITDPDVSLFPQILLPAKSTLRRKYNGISHLC